VGSDSIGTRIRLRSCASRLLLGVMAACSPSPLGQRADDLAAAQARWRAAAIPSYDFDFQRICFCSQEAVQPVTISVRSGRFAGIVSTDSATPVDTMLFQDFLTMDRIFDTTHRLLDAGPAAFTASYNAALGYPTAVTVDPIAQAVDDELTYQVLALRTIRAP
jgi:hypothetical protein